MSDEDRLIPVLFPFDFDRFCLDFSTIPLSSDTLSLVASSCGCHIRLHVLSGPAIKNARKEVG